MSGWRTTEFRIRCNLERGYLVSERVCSFWKKCIRILHIMHCICMIPFFFFFLQTKFIGLIFKNYGETMTLPCKMGPLLLWDITPLVNILNFCIQYITSNAKMHWKHTFLVFCNEKSLSYYKLCCQRLDVVLCHDQNLRELSINVRSWVKIFFL